MSSSNNFKGLAQRAQDQSTAHGTIAKQNDPSPEIHSNQHQSLGHRQNGLHRIKDIAPVSEEQGRVEGASDSLHGHNSSDLLEAAGSTRFGQRLDGGKKGG